MEPTARTAAAVELEAVRRRRAELRESLDTLEQSLAAPAAERAVVWGERVHEAMVAMVDEFREHVAVTEGPDGLHQSILSGDLRLVNAVSALTAEHEQIIDEITALVVATEPPVTPPDVEDVREQGTRLLGDIVRHRQRGADLIYEAFATDIGGGD